MASDRAEELYRVLRGKGYREELCAQIAYTHMNTDYKATRMLGYLYRIENPRVEDVVDEMLAIAEQIKTWREKKESEEAQWRYTTPF